MCCHFEILLTNKRMVYCCHFLEDVAHPAVTLPYQGGVNLKAPSARRALGSLRR